MTEELELRDRVAELIRSGDAGDAALDGLARDIFLFQRASCPAYAGWCDRLSVLGETVRAVRDVPAFPQEAWKVLRVSTADPARVVRTFRSSGTTGTHRSVQELPDLGLYELSLRQSFGAGLLAPGGTPQVHALLPSPAESPDSSLVFMVEHASAALGLSVAGWYVRDGVVDVPAVTAALAAADEPVLVIGTAFSFVHLLDEVPGARQLALPHGSIVMETGGFKGRSRSVDREALHAAMATTLGVPVESIINQYGMCETSTQFYDSFAPVRGKRPPPWARVSIVSPRSLTPVSPGETGMIQIYDPANLYTCAAILTADLGRELPDGRFEVLGRAASAEPRGCSLMVADLEGTR